jgi:hypothetical protein
VSHRDPIRGAPLAYPVTSASSNHDDRYATHDDDDAARPSCSLSCATPGGHREVLDSVATHDDLVERPLRERRRPQALHPRSPHDRFANVAHRDDRGALGDPEPLDLAVEPHPLVLVGH